jgi:putative membrane protein
VDIERVTDIFNRPVIKKMLLLFVKFSNICPAFTTTVYAFLNPKLPSAAWDFFCLRFGEFRFCLSVSCAKLSSPIAVFGRNRLFSTTTDWRFPGLSQRSSSMLVHWFLAAIHLLAFALGFWAVLTRGTAFSRLAAGVGEARRVLLADNLWGIAALVLLVTGGMRAFGGFEKGTDYYLHQPLFHLKMTLFVLILLTELAPMITLVKWRIALARGKALDTGRAKLFARISHVEALLLVLMMIAATGMARGVTFG